MPTLTFLNGALLAALAAVAAPLLIHLLSRKRLPEVTIASTWLLREARRESLRHLRLHDYILLALRTLIVAFLVLAAARPALRFAGVLGNGSSGGAIGVVLDATASMTAVAPGGSATVFDHARRRAEDIVRQSGADDAVTLIVSRGSTTTPDDVVRGRSDALALLQRVAPSYTAGNIASAAGDAVRRVAAEHHANKEVYVVSDFQQSALADIARETGSSDASVRIVLVPASEAPGGNMAIDRVAATAGTPPRIEATIANHTPDDATVAVDAAQPGRASRRTAVRVGAQSRAVAVFATGDGSAGSDAPAGVDPGAGTGEVQLPPDALSVDNVRYFVTTGHAVLRVLLIGREATAGDRDTGGIAPLDFPRLALTTNTGVGPSFSVQTGSPGSLMDLDPSRADVVLLANPPRLSAASLRSLRSYVSRGGSVFLSLGAGSSPAALNAEILPALAPGGVRATDVIERTNGSFLSLLPTNVGHPVFAGFRIGAGAALSGARFTSCVSMAPGSGVRTLARFGDGTPALLEAPGVLVFASSLDMSWGDFPTSGSYLPFLHQALAYLATGRPRPAADHLVGDRAPVRLSSDDPTTLVQCVGPNGAIIGVTQRRVDDRAAFATDPVPAPGIWLVRSSGRVIDRLAVNVDTRESDLARPRDADLARLLGRRNVSVLRPSEHVASYIGRLRHGRELWREFLVCALALLVVEQWLGRTRAAARPTEGTSRAA